jgi:cytochrome c-type biogenesis protein CcmH
MSWALPIGLALAAFVAMAFVLRLPRVAWTSALAALALGLAGYALQGRPGLAGSPTRAAPAAAGVGEAMVELRRAVLPDRFHSRSSWLITADALARRDRPADAATMLRGAIRENPRDAEAWLALANALTAAGEGVLTPAAQYAYRRAEQLAPESPGVPFFVGVAQLQANNLLDARMLWDQAARRAPEGSEERAEIAARVARLDTVLQQIVAAREAQGAPAE